MPRKRKGGTKICIRKTVGGQVKKFEDVSTERQFKGCGL